MQDACYLTFRVQAALYAVPAQSVSDIFLLPALTPLPDAPAEIAGICDLRGRFIAVLDLRRRLGLPARPANLLDSVVVVRKDDRSIGVLVDEVLEVVQVPLQAIDAIEPAAGEGETAPLIAQASRHEDRVLLLPNEAALLQYADWVPSSPPGTPPYSEGTDLEAIFAERARSLARIETPPEAEGFWGLAVVGLNGEHFGIPIEFIRGFADSRVTPIPCCPPHILGHINLRGETLVVVDIRGFLNLPVSSGVTLDKVAVVQSGSVVVGIGVSDILDPVRVDRKKMVNLPVAAELAGRTLLVGTIGYDSRVLNILDIAALIASGELTVNEEV